MSATVNGPAPDPIDMSGHAPPELRRRLRQASVLLGAAELPTSQREAILRRVRHHLSGTLRKLDDLIAMLAAAPVSLDDQLTERHEGAKITPSP